MAYNLLFCEGYLNVLEFLIASNFPCGGNLIVLIVHKLDESEQCKAKTGFGNESLVMPRGSLPGARNTSTPNADLSSFFASPPFPSDSAPFPETCTRQLIPVVGSPQRAYKQPVFIAHLCSWIRVVHLDDGTRHDRSIPTLLFRVRLKELISILLKSAIVNHLWKKVLEKLHLTILTNEWAIKKF